jgi:hypothetical protein
MPAFSNQLGRASEAVEWVEFAIYISASGQGFDIFEIISLIKFDIRKFSSRTVDCGNYRSFTESIIYKKCGS